MTGLPSTEPRAQIINIIIEAGREGLFYARSPELPGLLVAEESLDALSDEIPRVIEGMFHEMGKAVDVYKAERPHGSDALGPPPWVAIPAHIAANAPAE